MKREIKFRAWSKKYGMVYSDNHRTVWCGGIEVSVNTDHGKLMDEFEAMQYVEIKSKELTEMYEGDIVKSDYYSGTPGVFKRIIGVIAFHSGKFQVDGIGKYDGMRVELHGNTTIIGNIYENPQLLVNKI